MSGRERGARTLAAAVAVAAVLLCVPAAGAKDFRPGDLRVCGPDACAAVRSRPVLALLSRLYYTGPQPARAADVPLGARGFELRFRNGYATGVVGAAELDRFLSFGVYLGRFQPRAWYTVPPRAARELRRLTARMRPYAVTAETLDRSR
jgi:hypothetical protein